MENKNYMKVYLGLYMFKTLEKEEKKNQKTKQVCYQPANAIAKVSGSITGIGVQGSGLLVLGCDEPQNFLSLLRRE